MLFNIDTGEIKKSIDCFTCPFFDKKLKKCNGIGKTCFEYDQKTMTIIDPVTGLPLKK